MGRTRMSIVLLVVIIACKLGDPARSNGSDGSEPAAKPVPPESTTAGSERRGVASAMLFTQPRQREVRNGASETSGTANRGLFINDAAAMAAVKASVAMPTTTTTTTTTTTATTPSASVSSQLDSRSSVPAATDNLNDTSTTTPATFTPSKRRSVNRDNKLMSVLQARRTALSRDRWQKEYVPSSVLKLHRHSNPAVNLVEDSSTPESNLIIPPGARPEEFLDTDESIHGMYVVNPRNGKVAAPPQIKLAKETSNLVAQHNNKSVESTKLTSAKQILARGSYYEPRTKRTRDRKTVSTTTERSVEDGDLIPYQFFGQKLIPTSRNADSRNQVLNPKGTRLTKLKDDSQEILEVSAPKTSTEKNKFWQNRLAYQSRNIVAFNNYLRRNGKDGLHAVTPVQTSSTTTASSISSIHADSLTNSMIALSNLSEGSVDSKQVFSRSANFSSLNKTEIMVQSSTVTAGNVEESTTATTSTTVASTQNIPANHKPDDELPALFSPTGQAAISKLIINYPDDATPEDLYHPNSYQSVPEHVSTITTSQPEQVSETTQINMEDFENRRNMVSIPDINHIFQNLSTSPTTTTTTEMPIPVKRMSPVETKVELADSSTEIYVPVMTTTTTSTELTKEITTTQPPESSSTTSTPESTTPATSTTTVPAPAPFSRPSTTLPSTTTTTSTTTSTSTTTVPTTKVEITTQPEADTDPPYKTDERFRTLQQPSNATQFNPILPHILPKLTRDPIPQSRVPTIVDYNTPPAGVDNRGGTTATKKPAIAFEGVLLQHNSDVVIEMRKMNTATFILAGLGMLPIVIIILYVIKAAVCKREHKVSHDLERYISDGQPPISPVVRLEQSDTSSVADESIITDRDFNRKNLRFKSLLGEGNFGQVWKAEADDLAGHFGTTRIVAVKTERSDNGHGDLKAEAEIMRKLGSHPNVVTLLGVCLEQEPQLLIMEYAMRGRLLSLLRAARGAVNGLAPSVHGNRPPIMPLSPRRLTGFAHDIARGMEYISEKKIVHRDLAARNVLLDHNGICKICDFGMSIDLEKMKSSQAHIRIPRAHHSESRFKFDLSARSFGIGRHHSHGGHEGFGRHGHGRGHDSKSRPALPIRWMAPEALQYHIFSRETDVWAFGIVLWEITTLGCTPYPNLSGREVVRSVPNGIRPDIPPDCRPELYDLMHRTWRKDPRQRPTFSEARTSLARTLCQWQLEETDTSNTSEYLDVSGFSEDLEQGMVYFNRRISEFECEI
ncbi:mucin-5AC [Sabethes cyaneus]|uniref:mucin-5AC n=1 Tax=Sabethes cyaneus TaxID=53552 RepID=UPI00237E041F|nr:mucin-5AC [Sabethes cyaneus]XP_053689554.1 mucin-5AC [Sabethes cyaneus]